jgi:hypothetical protein
MTSEGIFPSRFYNCICIFHRLHACYMTRSSQLIRLDHTNKTGA